LFDHKPLDGSDIIRSAVMRTGRAI
jgi:hypothetical protein